MQTKTQSFIEAATNTLIGYAISVGVGQIVYPLFGYEVSISDNMGLTAIFVAVSLTRSYVFRRFFNWRHSNETSDSVDPARRINSSGTERTIRLRPYVGAGPAIRGTKRTDV